jgi:hypothetical protein
MTSLSSRRRSRTLLMLGTTIVVVIVAVALLVTGTDAIRQYTAAKRADAGLPVETVPDTPTAMFATVDADNQLTSVAVFVLDPSLTGGSIVDVPINVDATQGVGEERLGLAQAYEQDGPTGLVQAVESALSMSVDYFTVDDPAKAAGVLLPAGATTVDLPSAVAGTELQAGSQTLDSGQLAKVLTTTSSKEKVAQRTPNIDAVWTSVAQAVGTGKAPATMPAGVGSFEDLATRLFAGPVGARGLPVSDFAPKTPNVEGKDLALLDRAEQLMVFASIAPGSMSRPADGLAVRIVAPPGSEARVKDAIAILLYSGYNIASVDLTGTPRDTTEVLVYDDTSKSTVDGLKPYFGDFTYGKPTSQPDGIEVTIELGNDFITSSTTPTTPVTTSTTLAGVSG